MDFIHEIILNISGKLLWLDNYTAINFNQKKMFTGNSEVLQPFHFTWCEYHRAAEGSKLFQGKYLSILKFGKCYKYIGVKVYAIQFEL